MAKKPKPEKFKVGDPRFRGATPGKLAHALLRREVPAKPPGKATNQRGRVK